MNESLCVGEFPLDQGPVRTRLYGMEVAGPLARSFSVNERNPGALLDPVPSATCVSVAMSGDMDDVFDGFAFGDDDDIVESDVEVDVEDDKDVEAVDEDYGDDDSDLDADADDDDDDDYDDDDDDLDDLDDLDDDDDDLFDDDDDDL